MTMEYFDGFDLVGESGEEVSQELLGRGWYSSENIQVTPLTAEGMWTNDTARPVGKMLHLGSSTGNENTSYIQHHVKHWFDNAVGLNIMYATVPTGGPYKLIEFCRWSGTAMQPRYTLCIEEGEFVIYSYGEVGSGATKDATAWTVGTLQPNVIYSIHFYARLSMRLLYINGEAQALTGGLTGHDKMNCVRLYPTTGVYVDDFYSSFTQPEIRFYHYDTLYPLASEDGQPHRVLTLIPIQEIDLDDTYSITGESLVDAITGSDETFAQRYIRDPGKFEVQLSEPVYHLPRRGWYAQPLVRCARYGSLPALHFLTEARLPGFNNDYEGSGAFDINAQAALERWFHIDTVGIGNGDIRPSPMDTRTEVNHTRMMGMSYYVMSQSALLAQTHWSLWDRYQPDVYAQGA